MHSSFLSNLSPFYSRAFFLLVIKKNLNLAKNWEINQFLLKLFQEKKFGFFQTLLKFPKTVLAKELEVVLKNYLPPEWMNFLLIVVEDGYFSSLLKILTILEKSFSQKLGIKTAFIYSSVLLSLTQLKTVKDKLVSKYKAKIKIINKLDKKLLAGAVLKFDNEIVDNSYQKQLQDLQKHLLKTLIV